MLPMTGTASPAWRLFTDGRFLKRQVDGTDSAGWRIAAVSPNNFIRILCGPVVRNPRRLLFQLPNRAATTPRNSLGLPELLDGFFFFHCSR